MRGHLETLLKIAIQDFLRVKHLDVTLTEVNTVTV